MWPNIRIYCRTQTGHNRVIKEEKLMNNFTGIALIILASAVMLAACSDTPTKRDPYNDADSQRTRAQQSQGELSSETK